MICKDCQPVFYEPSELDEHTLPSLRKSGHVLKHIELCPRHEDMERKHVTVEGMLATVEATLANAVAILELAEQHQKRGSGKREARTGEAIMKLDAKFEGEIRKVKDGSIVSDDEYVVFLAKDNAFAAILPLYRDKCIELDCDQEQILAVTKMIARVDLWRREHPERLKNPDAAGEKLLEVDGAIEKREQEKQG